MWSGTDTFGFGVECTANQTEMDQLSIDFVNRTKIRSWILCNELQQRQQQLHEARFKQLPDVGGTPKDVVCAVKLCRPDIGQRSL